VISKYGIKTTCKRLLSFQRTGKRLSIDETALSMANSILFYQQSSKRKKETIVAMIAGTKAQTVIAIEKYRLNYEIQFMR
jgi:hypothetical protein